MGIIPDKICPADVDESQHKNEKPKDLALRLAVEKSQKIALTEKDAYILAADTVVSRGNLSLPKTENEEALYCLKHLSGSRHDVYTGVSLITPEQKIIKKRIKSSVKFRILNNNDIEEYINSKEWKGKAGGYAIQGLAEKYIKHISGSHSNIVGLPLYETINILNGAGYKYINQPN